MDWETLSKAVDEYEKLHPVMNLNTETGGVVVFKYPENGRQPDVERAAEFLLLNGEYTVEKISVGGSTSFVKLKEVPGVVFNTVQFVNKEAI